MREAPEGVHHRRCGRPEARCRCQSTSPASTTTTMAATCGTDATQRCERRLKSMCSNGGTEPEGVVPRGSTTRSPARIPTGQDGRAAIEAEVTITQRVAAAAMCTPSSAVRLVPRRPGQQHARVSASARGTTARRRDTLLPARGASAWQPSCTTAPHELLRNGCRRRRASRGRDWRINAITNTANAKSVPEVGQASRTGIWARRRRRDGGTPRRHGAATSRHRMSDWRHGRRSRRRRSAACRPRDRHHGEPTGPCRGEMPGEWRASDRVERGAPQHELAREPEVRCDEDA